MLAVEKTGGLLALSHKAAVSGFPQPATVALAVAEAHRKTFCFEIPTQDMYGELELGKTKWLRN